MEGVGVMKSFQMIRLCDEPERLKESAQWFHEKWNIPLEAYKESMQECISKEYLIPQWYLAIEQEEIIGGMGVIENDFHNRKDLSPNVCAVYVKPDRRGKGIAGDLLTFVCEDMHERGIDVLYLITDHIGFYERYGWTFHCMVQGDGELDLTRMYRHQYRIDIGIV